MKRIFDPIHHVIELEPGETALLDTAPMQRLRRLRQLGLAHLAFPAAEHSRFGHVLGAMVFGDRVLSTLRRTCPEAFSDEAEYHRQRRLLRASLLLHDVGHGPFSHSCEAVLGVHHEARTAAILAEPDIATALERLEVDAREVLALITGAQEAHPILRELVSGPNLDADRMDYLQRDAYFTGVNAGRYDADQLVASLRIYNHHGRPILGVDGRGRIALESFVMARYFLFASVYFHHTTRAFERSLHEALHLLWPDPRRLDTLSEFLAWDDMRVIDALRTLSGEAALALRNRRRLYSLIAEYDTAHDDATFAHTARRLRERYGDALWEDTQAQLLHRLPLGTSSNAPTIFVQTASGLVDAREASDLIAKLSGRAFWRKLYLRRSAGIDIEEARRLARESRAIETERSENACNNRHDATE